MERKMKLKNKLDFVKSRYKKSLAQNDRASKECEDDCCYVIASTSSLESPTS